MSHLGVKGSQVQILSSRPGSEAGVAILVAPASVVLPSVFSLHLALGRATSVLCKIALVIEAHGSNA